LLPPSRFIDRAHFSVIIHYVITQYVIEMKPVKAGTAMPLVKVIRNGQITIPKELRAALGIEEGDLLEVRLSEAGMTIKPKAAVDRELAGGRFFEMTEQIRESVKDADPRELDEAIAEAVAAAKKVTARKIKARQPR
jgi:AbrB family looped-hinge helix DNA binding protein